MLNFVPEGIKKKTGADSHSYLITVPVTVEIELPFSLLPLSYLFLLRYYILFNMFKMLLRSWKLETALHQLQSSQCMCYLQNKKTFSLNVIFFTQMCDGVPRMLTPKVPWYFDPKSADIV